MPPVGTGRFLEHIDQTDSLRPIVSIQQLNFCMKGPAFMSLPALDQRSCTSTFTSRSSSFFRDTSARRMAFQKTHPPLAAAAAPLQDGRVPTIQCQLLRPSPQLLHPRQRGRVPVRRHVPVRPGATAAAAATEEAGAEVGGGGPAAAAAAAGSMMAAARLRA